MSTTQVIESEVSENFQRALEIFRTRQGELASHPDGYLRLGNVINLARWGRCCDAEDAIREMMSFRGIDSYSIDDTLIKKVCDLFAGKRIVLVEGTMIEIRAMIELAEAAGLKEEAAWMSEIWG